MLEEMGFYFWSTVSLLKMLHEHGQTDILEHYRRTVIDSDCLFEIAWEAIFAAFQDVRNYLNEERYIETIVFYDPMMERFFRLCAEYENLMKISSDNNRFRHKLTRTISYDFSLSDYNHDYILYDSLDHKHGCKIVFLMDEEFYSHEELAFAIWDIRDTFEAVIDELEKDLTEKKRQPSSFFPPEQEEWRQPDEC